MFFKKFTKSHTQGQGNLCILQHHSPDPPKCQVLYSSQSRSINPCHPYKIVTVHNFVLIFCEWKALLTRVHICCSFPQDDEATRMAYDFSCFPKWENWSTPDHCPHPTFSLALWPKATFCKAILLGGGGVLSALLEQSKTNHPALD